MNTELLTEFEEVIGYEFKDKSLLQKALTHSSYANEQRLPPHSDNERLEFLGDAVLELVSSEFLYLNYSNLPEGELTKLRASLVCEPTLAMAAEELSLGKYLRLSHGEDKTGGRKRKSVLSDALEAVIGALFLDGGIEKSNKLIFAHILTDIEHKQLFHDSKTRLQEIVQGSFGDRLSYVVTHEEGPDHAKQFSVEARIGSRVIGRGIGGSKKAAEQEAAYRGILYLRQKPPTGE